MRSWARRRELLGPAAVARTVAGTIIAGAVAVALHEARELVRLRGAHGDRELRVLARARHVVVDDADVQDVALLRRASSRESEGRTLLRIKDEALKRAPGL